MVDESRQVDRRVVDGELRVAASEDGPTMLSGYAAVFNRETVIESWVPFREVILPGAFTEAIGTDDVRLLFNHDPNKLLARTANRTLRLSEDATGLHYEADLNPADPEAVSVAAKVSRGDVSQSSFAFQVKEEHWIEVKGQMPLRQIKKVAPLYDVSAVTYPAYAQTTVSARAEERAKALAAPAAQTRTFASDPQSRAREWELRRHGRR